MCWLHTLPNKNRYFHQISPLVYSIRKNQHMLPKCWLLLKVIYRAIKEVLNRLESYQMFVHDVCIEKFTPNFFNFYQILKKICWKWQNLLKTWKNGIFQHFSFLIFFQNHERYKKIVFTGMDWMHWGTFKLNIGSLNPETKKVPIFWSKVAFFAPFWVFLTYLDLQVNI